MRGVDLAVPTAVFMVAEHRRLAVRLPSSVPRLRPLAIRCASSKNTPIYTDLEEVADALGLPVIRVQGVPLTMASLNQLVAQRLVSGANGPGSGQACMDAPWLAGRWTQVTDKSEWRGTDPAGCAKTACLNLFRTRAGMRPILCESATSLGSRWARPLWRGRRAAIHGDPWVDLRAQRDAAAVSGATARARLLALSAVFLLFVIVLPPAKLFLLAAPGRRHRGVRRGGDFLTMLAAFSFDPRLMWDADARRRA